MTDETYLSEQRDAVHAEWRDRSGAWEKWADKLAELAARLNEPLLDAAGVSAGLRVLDLASGIGEPAFTAAARVGPDGHVTATDLVPEMLDGARRRAEAIGCENIAFEICGMEDLPFDDASFDAATSRFGIMFVPDVDTALAEIRRVLKPGARAAFMVWGPLAENTMFQIMEQAVAAQTGRSIHDLSLSPFRFADPESLAGPMTAAGFTNIEEMSLRFTPRIDAGIPFWTAHLEMSCGATLAEMSGDEKAALDGAIRDAFEIVRTGDAFVLENHIRLVRGVA